MPQSAGVIVEPKIIESLLGESNSYKVPPYQRGYAWGKNEVITLFHDLYDDFDWTRYSRESERYFLGAMVLIEEGGFFTVLDGQQRLATICLAISALKRRLPTTRGDDVDLINTLLQTKTIGEEPTPKVVLQPGDREIFKHLIETPKNYDSPGIRGTPLATAARVIDEELNDFLPKAQRRFGLGKPELVSRMASRLVYTVEVVRILAPSTAAAFRLFETLNYRGLELNAADLIKNKLLEIADKNAIENVHGIWKQIIEAVDESEIINFLRHYWIAFEEDPKKHVRRENLYDVYAERVKRFTPNEVLSFVKELKLAADVYGAIADPEAESQRWEDDTHKALTRLSSYGARSYRPALLVGAMRRQGSFSRLVKVCESAVVRYSLVCDKNPSVFEKTYAKLCEFLRTPREEFDSAISQTLGQLVPKDDEFVNSFKGLKIKSNSPSWRTILLRLDLELEPEGFTLESPKKVHIDHVLPRNPSAKALQEVEVGREEAEELALSVGNLTFLLGRTNEELSNKPFSQKRPKLRDSQIGFNVEIARNQEWTKSQIRKRAERLANLAKDVWPWPIP